MKLLLIVCFSLVALSDELYRIGPGKWGHGKGGPRSICSDGCKPTCSDGAIPLYADGSVPKHVQRRCPDKHKPRCFDDQEPKTCADGSTPAKPTKLCKGGRPSCGDNSRPSCTDGYWARKGMCNDGTTPVCDSGDGPVCPDGIQSGHLLVQFDLLLNIQVWEFYF